MTLAELIEFLSAHPGGTPIKTWNPEAADYLPVTGAVMADDGVLFFQTSPVPPDVRT
jgi:hypothetical protein